MTHHRFCPNRNDEELYGNLPSWQRPVNASRCECRKLKEQDKKTESIREKLDMNEETTEHQVATYKEKLAAAKKALEIERTRVGVLEKALEKYGQHDYYTHVNGREYLCPVSRGFGDCKCGFDQALKAAEQKSTTGEVEQLLELSIDELQSYRNQLSEDGQIERSDEVTGLIERLIKVTEQEAGSDG